MLSTQFSNSSPHSGSSIEVSSDLLNYWQGHSHRIALTFSPATLISGCITFTLNQGNNSSVEKKLLGASVPSNSQHQCLLSKGLHFCLLLCYSAVAHSIIEARFIYLDIKIVRILTDHTVDDSGSQPIHIWRTAVLYQPASFIQWETLSDIVKRNSVTYFCI